MARYFTLAEAERLLPELEQSLRDALFHKSEALAVHQKLEKTLEHIRTSGGARVNPNQIVAMQGQRDASTAALKDSLEQIERTGALVKDLDIGLIDFPSRFQDRDVCLCWKLGETGIAFWHGLEEGFRGRKPVDREFIQGHSNGDHSGGDRSGETSRLH